MKEDKIKLQDILRGTQVASWEQRLYPNGKRKVYVRLEEIAEPITMKVK